MDEYDNSICTCGHERENQLLKPIIPLEGMENGDINNRVDRMALRLVGPVGNASTIKGTIRYDDKW